MKHLTAKSIGPFGTSELVDIYVRGKGVGGGNLMPNGVFIHYPTQSLGRSVCEARRSTKLCVLKSFKCFALFLDF